MDNFAIQWLLGSVIAFSMFLGMFRLTFNEPATRFDVIMAAAVSLFGFLTVIGITIWFVIWFITNKAIEIDFEDWLFTPARKKHR